MSELLRQAYLDALGVDVYFPHIALPGALPSPLCEIVVPGEAELVPAADAVFSQVVAAPESTVSSHTGSAAAMRALLGEEKQKEKPSNKVGAVVDSLVSKMDASKPVARSTINTPVKTPHFSLSITVVSNIMIVDEAYADDVSEPDYCRLMQNLLFALGAGKQSVSVSSFTWPMLQSNHLDQSAAIAKQTLQASIVNQCEQASIAFLIVMGNTALDYFLDENLEQGQCLKSDVLPNVQIICCPSAAESMRQPRLKLSIWQQLKPLHHILQNN